MAIGSFDGRSALSSWLYRIAYNAFLNQERGAGRVEPLEDEKLALMPVDALPADDALIVAEESRRLRHAVLALDDDLRLAVTARYWGELGTSEIARISAVSEVTVRKRLRQALGQLGRALEGESR